MFKILTTIANVFFILAVANVAVKNEEYDRKTDFAALLCIVFSIANTYFIWN